MVALLAVPAWSFFGRLTVIFQSSFDGYASSAGHGNGGIPVQLFPAEVGQFETDAPDGAFVVEISLLGDGHLVATDVSPFEELVLHASFAEPYTGFKMTTAATFVPQQRDAEMTMRIEDESDTPLIDVGFTPDGDIAVDGERVMPYSPNLSYTFVVAISSPWLGAPSYSVAVTEGGSGQPAQVFTGQLGVPPGPFTVDGVDLVLPAGGFGGEFELDDLKVVVPTNFQAVEHAASDSDGS